MLKAIIALYVLTTCSALVLLKLGSANGAPVAISGSKLIFNINWVIIAAGTLYATSFLLYTYLISKFDLGYIVPLGIGLVYVLIAISSFVIFKEVFTIAKVIAITLILTGVVLINVK